MARSKKACIVFFDEIDAIGGARFDDGVGGDNEVQRTMLEIVNQLDGFDARGNIKVLMAPNRLDLLTIWLLFYEIFVAHLLLSISFCKV
jgi:26S proteasome regulatory subunit T1